VFDNIIWNTGTVSDTFNIVVHADSSSFPIGTAYLLLAEDGLTPLVDSNNDGVVDTGPVAPGTYVKVVMRMSLPAGISGNNGGGGFDIKKCCRPPR